MYDKNYLIHYGVIGMRWGQRRLQNRIANAKAIGNKEKAKKLQKRYDENKEISKMKTSDKIFLSREGVLANKRLIEQGQNKLSRLLTLHGINTVTSLGAEAVSNLATTSFRNSIVRGEHIVGNTIASTGANLAISIGAMKVRDRVYKEIGTKKKED